MKNTSVLDIYGGMRLIDCVKDYTFTSQDYFVHMLRFTKMCKELKDKRILDLGCGKYTNLLKAITQMSRGPHFNHYVGVDYGPIEEYRPNYEPVASRVDYLEYIDWTNDNDYEAVEELLLSTYGKEPFVIVCFEVLEHMDFNSQRKFLFNLSKLMHNPNLNVECCYFSTPNFNGNAAHNHISEIRYSLEEELFDLYGLNIVDSQGLSAWKRYHKFENLSSTFQNKIDKDLLEYLSDSLPDPLDKMMWGALLHRKYSNNILYTLDTYTSVCYPSDFFTNKETFNMLESKVKDLPHEGYRQNGNYAERCRDVELN